MKKLLLILSLLLCFSFLFGCSSTKQTENTPSTEETQASTELESPIEKFMGFIGSGEYHKATECYNNEIYGNYSLETDAVTALINELNSMNAGILNGEKAESDSKKLIGVIDNVVSETNLNIDNYEEIKENIKSSVSSKASFLAAKDLENLKNYSDAIAEYKKVLEADSNYSEAQTAIDRCTTTLKQDVFDKAASLVENNEYLEAISQLKSLTETIPDDEEIIAKISVYEKTYIKGIITSSEEIFVTPAVDYSKALEIINGALQHYPENEDLIAKKDYFNSFAPVNLYDMKKMKGDVSKLETDEDIYDNEYEKSFWSGYGSYSIWYDTDVTFNLNKAYNTFTATLYSRSSKNEAQYMTVEIYADGKVIYQNLKFADNGTQPITLNLDVTGVTELKIVLSRNNGAIGSGIGMSNMLIQKTVK